MPKDSKLKDPQYPEYVIPEGSKQGDVFGLKKTSSGVTTQVSTPAAAKEVKA